MTGQPPAQELPQGERAALARLLSEIQRASSANVDAEQVWALVGAIGAVAVIAASDLAHGADPERLHQLADQLVEEVARLEP